MTKRKCNANGKMRKQRGFSIIELLIVMVIALVLAALAIPGYQSMTRYLRLSGDMRNINGAVAQAKMRAAADFTRARAYADLNANTYHLEIWNKTGNCWQTDGDVNNSCTVAGTSPVQNLSVGVTYGTGGVGAGAPNPQTTIAQAAKCDDGAGGLINNTACIVFNSRGIPINGLTGAPLTGAQDAFYITDNRNVWGVTVRATGAIQVWATNVSQTSWQHR
ncbi:MAG TPA: type II secretion system protein [Candidatus Acidoferrum sp.]|nr:type II secretion system protein [Candidatus Acidoferrum sp.]